MGAIALDVASTMVALLASCVRKRGIRVNERTLFHNVEPRGRGVLLPSAHAAVTRQALRSKSLQGSVGMSG